MKARLIALLAACAMVTTAGCGTPAAPDSAPTADGSSQSQPTPAEPATSLAQEVDRDTIYTMSVDNNVIVSFDADGNVVQPQENQENGRVLSDILTDEPRYQIDTKTTDTGEDDEWGNPIAVKTTALYDMEGKLLYDYGKYTYGEGIGELVIRKDHRGLWASIDDIPADFFSELWNPVTGESVLSKVATVSILNKDSGLLAALDIFGNLLCTMDTSGKPVKSIEKGYQASISGGRIIVTNTPWDHPDAVGEQYTLMDENLEPIATAKNMGGRVSWQDKGLIMYRDDDMIGLMNNDGVKLFALSKDVGQYINFCDGELLIMSMVSDGQALMKIDGTQLGEVYDHIVPVCIDQYNLTEPPTQFAAQLDNTFRILDRQGNVVRSTSLPEDSYVGEVDGKYIHYRSKDDLSGLMDMEFNIIMPANKYNSIHVAQKYNDDDVPTMYDIIIARYYPRAAADGSEDYSFQRVDIYDGDMNLIIDSLSEVGTVGEGRIAVVRGFSAGVIDWQGNWIGKTSIFQTVGDER